MMRIVIGCILVLLLQLGAVVHGGTLGSIKAGVAESAPVQQVHIALAGDNGKGDSNTLAISWQTNIGTPTSTVRFGMKSGEFVIFFCVGTVLYCCNCLVCDYSHS